jgi:hypothetical protein
MAVRLGCPSTTGQRLGVGFLWLVLMLAFEVAFGRLVFRASWQRLAADFDFRKGGLLAIGMTVLLVAPCWWRNCAVWSDSYCAHTTI